MCTRHPELTSGYYKEIMSFKLKYIGFLGLIIFLSCKEEKTSLPVSKLPYFNSADFTPEWNKPRHRIPEFSFTNQNGALVTNKTYESKIYIADFFFTSCPGICPKLTKNMASLQEIYKNDNDVKLLSHTVMPWKDSVPVLKKYF